MFELVSKYIIAVLLVVLIGFMAVNSCAPLTKEMKCKQFGPYCEQEEHK